MGHTSRVNNVSFSHSRYAYHHCGGASPPTTNTTTATPTKTSRSLPQYTQPHYQLLSSSADGTARMWRHGSTDAAAVVFSHVKHSIGGAALSALSLASSSSASAVSAAFIGNTKKTSVESIKNSLHGGGGNGGSVGNMGINTYGAGSSGGAAQPKDARNRPFGDSITHASYFYMDKFTVLVSSFLLQ